MNAKIRVVAAMLIFGSMGLVVRNIDLPSSTIALVRGLIGVFFLMLVGICLKRPISKQAFLNNGLSLIFSGIALSANWIFLFEAYKHTTIATATLSYYLAPIFVIAVSPLVLQEKITTVKVVCIITSLVGMILVSGVLTSPFQGLHDFSGILYGSAAAVSYASLTILNKFIKNISSAEATIAQLGISAMVLLPYALWTHDLANVTAGGQTLILLIILGVIHTGFAFWLFFSSIQDLKAQTVAAFSYIDPVTAILFSALLLNEKMDFAESVGALLILGSTFISARLEKNPEKDMMSEEEKSSEIA